MREAIPEQIEMKAHIKEHLPKHGMVLGDVARETAIPEKTLYFWVNGRTTNILTQAYIQALRKWMKAHK